MPAPTYVLIADFSSLVILVIRPPRIGFAMNVIESAISGVVEVRHAPAPDLALPAQRLERADRLFERLALAPVQQIAIQAIGTQPAQAGLARLDRPIVARVARQHLRHQEHLIAPARDRL